MGKSRMLLLGALLVCATSAFAVPQVATATGTQTYEVKEFVADFTRFTIGDTVPEMYRSDQYNIKQWQQRNLPAPDVGSHWTYMGGNYVLITDVDGKILKAFSGDIFYQH
ncbi:RcnB family protein [Salmonella enterica]